ncbi:MAG: hypothetical protein ACKO4T_13040 [Planctomycetaceae bacterium]
MAADQEPVRFDIQSRATILDIYRAFRQYAEKVAAANGRTLAPAWYADGPKDRPELYKDQPHLLGDTSESGPEP